MNTLLAARQWNATVIIPVSFHEQCSQEGRPPAWLSVHVPPYPATLAFDTGSFVISDQRVLSVVQEESLSSGVFCSRESYLYVSASLFETFSECWR